MLPCSVGNQAPSIFATFQFWIMCVFKYIRFWKPQLVRSKSICTVFLEKLKQECSAPLHQFKNTSILSLTWFRPLKTKYVSNWNCSNNCSNVFKSYSIYVNLIGIKHSPKQLPYFSLLHDAVGNDWIFLKNETNLFVSTKPLCGHLLGC